MIKIEKNLVKMNESESYYSLRIRIFDEKVRGFLEKRINHLKRENNFNGCVKKM